MLRKRDIAMYAVALVLAFAVGILVGRDCGPSPVETEKPQPVVAQCDPIRDVVYECPPDAGTPQDEPTGQQVATPKPKSKALPNTEKPISPRQRKQLLAWVRDQSVDLEGCRSAAKETYRLSVTLELEKDGRVTAVRLNAPSSELPTNVAGCLRERMRSWQPPEDLVDGRHQLVFGLTL